MHSDPPVLPPGVDAPHAGQPPGGSRAFRWERAHPISKQAFIGKPTKGLLRFLVGASFLAKTGKATFRNDA
jgi:hypothetical protein